VWVELCALIDVFHCMQITLPRTETVRLLTERAWRTFNLDTGEAAVNVDCVRLRAYTHKVAREPYDSMLDSTIADARLNTYTVSASGAGGGFACDTGT
jgi:hypothetical protein